MTNLSDAIDVLRDTGKVYPAVLTPALRQALLTFYSDVQAAYVKVVDTDYEEPGATRGLLDDIEQALWPEEGN